MILGILTFFIEETPFELLHLVLFGLNYLVDKGCNYQAKYKK